MRAAATLAAGLVVLTAMAAPLVGCGTAHRARLAVDERSGMVERILLGERGSAVVAALGKPGSTESPFAPLGKSLVDVGGPPAIPVAGHAQLLRYAHIAVLLSDSRVISILTDDPGARTRRGIRIGDSLAAARRAYPTLTCRRAPAGESASGEITYPFCSARLDGMRIGLGRDPIRSITLTAAR